MSAENPMANLPTDSHPSVLSQSESSECVIHSLEEAKEALTQFLESEYPAKVAVLAENLAHALDQGNRVLIAGNGGSMADAMHFAEELTGRFRKDRKPLAAIALTDPTHMSCVANDYGFNHVFSRLVEAYARPGDWVILLSTSGNSENLVLAANAGKAAGAQVAGFLGRDGGKLLPLCDMPIFAPGKTSDRIQEIHMLCLHILVEAIEKLLGLA
jgi:D-sedoheptulose 7-phosphate isomerase